MSIPEACIDAARIHNELGGSSDAFAKARARRVILALAEEMPPDAAIAAHDELAKLGWLIPPSYLMIAIAAALKRTAGETP